MDADNRRSSTRYPVQLSGTVTVNDDAVPVDVMNLSLGGAFVGGLDRLTIGAQVVFSFSIPTHEVPIEVAATIRWCTELGIGLQFGSLRAREVWSLNKFFEDFQS